MSSDLGKSAAVTLENISAAIAGTGLMDLIKVVRACKTAAEERAVIARESAELRQCFREDGENHYRNMVKVRSHHNAHTLCLTPICMNAHRCSYIRTRSNRDRYLSTNCLACKLREQEGEVCPSRDFSEGFR